jgi:hypothetical protein
MIHVALFSFQRTTCLVRTFPHVPYDIYYFIAACSVCQDILKISFLSELETFSFQMLASQGFSSSVSRVSRGDLYHITRFASPCQHPFQKKDKNEDEQLRDKQLLVFIGKESFILERNGGSGIHFTCRGSPWGYRLSHRQP